MMHRTLAAAAASVVLIAGCTQSGGVLFHVPIAEARQILLGTGLPPLVFGSLTPDWTVRADGASQVIWTARRNEADLFSYVAHLSEDGSGATRVRLEMKGANADVEKGLSTHPEAKEMYLVAMNEQIASALERRKFDPTRIYPAMTAAAMSNVGNLQASADQAAEASNREARENIEKAYAEEAAGRR